MAKKPQLPLKDVMAAIDKKTKSFYTNLSDEQKKAFSAWMMMRYCSSVQGKHAANYIYMTNELVNLQFSEVSKHPELQWLLLSACGSGKVEFHPYIKPPHSKKKKNKVFNFMKELLPDVKDDDLEVLISINVKDDLKEFAKRNGCDDKTIKDVFGK